MSESQPSPSTPSPSKKRRLSLRSYREKGKQGSSVRLYIGEILNAANACRTSTTVAAGSRRNVFMRAMVTDYAHGRMKIATRNFSFITVADCTATFRLCMEGQATGLNSLGLPQETRNDKALCYFPAELYGDISWRASREKSSEASYFFNGQIERSPQSPISLLKTGSLPTSDVLFKVATIVQFRKPCNVTSAFVGRIYLVEKENNTITLGIEDSVGSAMLELRSVQKTSEFCDENHLCIGNYVTFSGTLQITDAIETDDEKSVCLVVNHSDVSVDSSILSTFYDECFQELMKLRDRDSHMFEGTVPEPLQELNASE